MTEIRQPVKGRPLPPDFPFADKERIEELRRIDRRAIRRGVWVPPELEEDWRLLKSYRMSNAEAAKALGLKMRSE
jgi:hypothetical protein